MKCYIQIKNSIGEFNGSVLDIPSEEEYIKLKTRLSKFYDESGFELYLQDGSYMVIGQEVLKLSVLRLIEVLD